MTRDPVSHAFPGVSTTPPAELSRAQLEAEVLMLRTRVRINPGIPYPVAVTKGDPKPTLEKLHAMRSRA